MKFQRENYNTYEEWRAAWSVLMEPVINDVAYNKYLRMIAKDEYEQANAFFDSVMDKAASQRNSALAESLGL